MGPLCSDCESVVCGLVFCRFGAQCTFRWGEVVDKERKWSKMRMQAKQEILGWFLSFVYFRGVNVHFFPLVAQQHLTYIRTQIALIIDSYEVAVEGVPSFKNDAIRKFLKIFGTSR